MSLVLRVSTYYYQQYVILSTIKKLYPKTSAGNTRPIAASNSFVAQTRDGTRVSDIFRNGFFSVKSVNLSFWKWVGLRVPNETSHPGDSWKNKFIFVTPKIHRVLSILSCGALPARPWEMNILRNTTCLCAKVP